MSAARAIERIRPHIPLIKFRFVKGSTGTGSVAIGASKAKSNSSTSNVGTRRGDSIEFTSLPLKYRRLALTPQEVDYINRGGPD
ncbi:28S ribosomal protein S36, mitochondrial-like isoform X1 [Patiria miniata]|uniref:Mitochondrial ribosomal protein S36 n=1 Tax=Patiria miniata TaxID=46514 RepID=A0A914BDQ0_PATMI|nr:28S ribosomal protein S36, mitochondrial-like isoform X1 [Patiria miniata]